MVLVEFSFCFSWFIDAHVYGAFNLAYGIGTSGKKMIHSIVPSSLPVYVQLVLLLVARYLQILRNVD
jgi:hypothetical protein